VKRKWVTGGNVAEGFLVFANVGSGAITLGNVAHGGLFAFGNLAVGGLVAVGNVAVAPIAIGGTNAIGIVAISPINAVAFVYGAGGLSVLPPAYGFVVALAMLGVTFVARGERPVSSSLPRAVVDAQSLLSGDRTEGRVVANVGSTHGDRMSSGGATIDVDDSTLRAQARERRPALLARVRAEPIGVEAHDYRDASPSKTRLVCIETEPMPLRPMWWEDRKNRYWFTGWCWRFALVIGLFAWIARLAHMF